ncbi:type I glyceraldehyde-3-phosphate dehydrogenase [Tepidimicrobium xylanilyticum]|uniref:Glyceraldehyde-3-phosphate dehydrogenase n=1 Tax=Tepidimicrobium xylanilyticum TaxID=1123352 RepID=A0A1H3A0L1_9FIRM|nr:type I glyceraldehyde-3-phosphate dehydrogenase [Tepidimicrobium xylanilyticum]GMG96353.1 glyceraldehyde-3-phosphate dehydrogenase [Tepidimicrobium xylanilyticum]SDX23123.1 glyceraldehyde 3-phosphate dehydrogenase [Tepidimicrobium xylanilyticum]
MTMKVGLSGFGRMGKDFLRIYAEENINDFELVALNASGDLNIIAHLFKYDSLYGKFNGTVEVAEDGLIINGKKIKVIAHRDPSEIPWKELGVDLVIDSTGAFRDRDGLQKHIDAGAKKVILTAPGKNEDITIVMGVNEDKYDPENHHIISNASCTTNCLAPVAKVILNEFGIKKGLMTTIHAYTNDQRILDKRHKDLRRARAAAESMIPTTTGAAKAVALVLPELKGKLNGFAVRVPVPTVSLVDVVFEVERETTVEEVNAALKKAAEGELKGIMAYSEEPLVSRDYQGDPHSATVDALSTMVIGNMVKVVAWYDNEWGYAKRVVDLAKLVANK